jgi:secondary thiamine-phosphate synthase enzyme
VTREPVSIRVASRGSREAIDVTGQVAEVVTSWPDLVALVSIDHTSAAIVLAPSDDGMLADFARVAERWLAALRPFEHLEANNPNGEAHVLSAFAGTRLLVEVAGGSLRLGRWQRILLLEFDGPQERTVRILPLA